MVHEGYGPTSQHRSPNQQPSSMYISHNPRIQIFRRLQSAKRGGVVRERGRQYCREDKDGFLETKNFFTNIERMHNKMRTIRRKSKQRIVHINGEEVNEDEEIAKEKETSSQLSG